ncbi:MAG: glycoside hydrolase family 125 protein, partial [Opitutales bacterium]
MNRRDFLSLTALTATGLLTGTLARAVDRDFPVVRTPAAQRRFRSRAVERTIARVHAAAGNREIAWMFENCFPNTLDTTVEQGTVGGRPDTYVITGDIGAMWLRDSSAQVWPYLPLLTEDPELRQLIAGVINRQTRCILMDPYANAFYRDDRQVGEWRSDRTEMKPGVHERKWEIDSLCYPIRLAHGYWRATGDATPFDSAWHDAVALTVRTFREQQRKTGRGPYSFQRRTETPDDTLAGQGYGNPARPVGLIHAMFRPSDDATIFPFLIPANFFAVVSLRQAAVMVAELSRDPPLAAQCEALAAEVGAALRDHAAVEHPRSGRIYAYEVDGFGNSYCIDDGNIPSLLSLPYLGAVEATGGLYRRTRAFLLSEANPYYCTGKAAAGPGGPHAGPDMIWP